MNILFPISRFVLASEDILPGELIADGTSIMAVAGTKKTRTKVVHKNVSQGCNKFRRF